MDKVGKIPRCVGASVSLKSSSKGELSLLLFFSLVHAVCERCSIMLSSEFIFYSNLVRDTQILTRMIYSTPSSTLPPSSFAKSHKIATRCHDWRSDLAIVSRRRLMVRAGPGAGAADLYPDRLVRSRVDGVVGESRGKGERVEGALPNQ